MRRGPLEETLPDESFTKEQLNVLFRPAFRGETLEEHHDFLKVHLDEFVGPLHQEGGADVEMEFGEALFFSLSKVR